MPQHQAQQTLSISVDTFHIICLDDGSFIFLIHSLEIINKTFKDMGLEMHVERDINKSRTEAILPTSCFFNQPTMTITNSNTASTIVFNPVDDTRDEEGQSINIKHTYSKLSLQQ